MTVRALFIDLGGVIVRTEFQAPRQHLAERLGLEYEDVSKIVFDSETAIQATLGAITEEEHWAAVAKRLHLPVSESTKLRDEFFAGDVIDHVLVDYLRELRKKMRVGLISNAWSGLRQYITEHKFEDAFDVMIISAEVGVAKPDPRIFQAALEQLDAAPVEAIFVDDFPQNVKAALAVGMQAIQFSAPEQALDELETMLAAPM